MFSELYDVLSRFCQARAKRSFLISNVPAGNLTLCAGNMLPASYGLSGPAFRE